MKNMFDFFYSKSLNLYVSRKPLIMDSRVKKISQKYKIEMQWDEQGRINNIDFNNTKKLLLHLGSKMLTPTEYFQVLNDAILEKDKDMVLQLTSKEYTEWLDRVYFVNEQYIDNPKILKKNTYSGKIQKTSLPNVCFGWFDLNKINKISGEPTTIKIDTVKTSFSWLFYKIKKIENKQKHIIPIRGYVYSEERPFLDLRNSPSYKKSTHLVREVRKEPTQSSVDISLILEVNDLIKKKNKDKILSFIEKHGYKFSTSYEQTIYRTREIFFDILGELSLSKDVTFAISQVSCVNNTLITYNDLLLFLKNRKNEFKLAIKNNKDVVFVMGHKNPDTDTVVSSIFEAYRNHLLNGKNICYVPIVQCEVLPKEISVLLENISKHLLFTNDTLYTKAKNSGLARWIAVDHNKDLELQIFFISVVDHHKVNKYINKKSIPKTIEMIGSTSALVANKFFGMGVSFSKEVAKILYSATLMDTDNRVKHKMTPKDTKIMKNLKKISEVKDDDKIYSNLMKHLLVTTDSYLLFYRDYKEDWGFGFSEIKLKHIFNKQGNIKQSTVIKNLLTISENNTVSKNLPFTLLKISDYLDDNKTINKERIYLVFNKNITNSFKKIMLSTIESVIKSEFPKNNCVVKENYVDFSGVQLSRKKIAPVLKLVMKIEMQNN